MTCEQLIMALTSSVIANDSDGRSDDDEVKCQSCIASATQINMKGDL